MNLSQLIGSMPGTLADDVKRLEPLIQCSAEVVAAEIGIPADDVVQEFLIRLLTAASKFRGESARPTYLFSVVSRKASDMLRKDRVRRTLAPRIQISTATRTRADHVELQVDACRFLRRAQKPLGKRQRTRLRAEVRAWM